jgi:hypothetical protein
MARECMCLVAAYGRLNAFEIEVRSAQIRLIRVPLVDHAPQGCCSFAASIACATGTADRNLRGRRQKSPSNRRSVSRSKLGYKQRFNGHPLSRPALKITIDAKAVLLAQDYTELYQAISRREESMASECLFNGKVTCRDGDSGEIVPELTYGTVSKTLPAKLWSDPTSDSLADIRGAMRLVSAQCGAAATWSSWAGTPRISLKRTKMS